MNETDIAVRKDYLAQQTKLLKLGICETRVREMLKDHPGKDIGAYSAPREPISETLRATVNRHLGAK